METIVRDGKFFTVGDSGAGFYQYKKGDIIFNHKQTEELFANGKVTSGGGRGRALVSGTAFATGSNGSGGGFWGSGSSSSSSKKKSSSSSSKSSSSKSSSKSSSDTSKAKEEADEFLETIDWIETAIDRIERAIDQLDTKASSVYRSWSERNSNLTSEISRVSEEISLQQKAYNRYIQEANSVGLSSSYAEKVRNGEINIEDIKDESLKEKIDEYQEYYEKALDCQDAILELTEREKELYQQRFDNVSTQYEGILSVIEHEKNILEEYIAQTEANAILVSANYYNALISNERKTIAQLEKEKLGLLSALQTAVQSGKIARNSEAWYEMVGSIDEVTQSIQESNTQLIEWQQTIQQLSWTTFDLLQDKISSVSEEAEFLIELLSSDKLFDDNGQLTDEGSATMGLHGQNYNTYMYQAEKAGKEAERLKKELAKDPYDSELEERYREMVALQQEYISNAEDEKNAIRDLVEEGINLELEALDKRIEKYNETLDAEKNLYDYQKKIAEQTKNIASLEKQMVAYSGDNSEEAQQKIQELKVSLEEAKADLEESEWDKQLSDTQQMLDELYLSYEETLNTRLDGLDALISDMIVEINTDASLISETIRDKADSVGYTLSDSMRTIWNENSVSTRNVITTYGDKFLSATTTTNNALNAINTNLQNMLAQLNKQANTNVKSASTGSTSSAANSKQANTTKPATTTTTTKKPTTTATNTAKAITVGGKINAGSAKIYEYAGDKTGARQYYRNDPIYKVLKTSGDWLQVRWHKLSSGITGWFKKGDVKAYKTGVKDLLDSQIAWTQENGKEFIVRPSDGAILTPLAKGDSVLNAKASSNIWNMANNPTEFIKDNLNLGVASVPNNSNAQSNYNQTIDKVVFSLPNVKNYEQLLSEMQRDPNFERLILSMSIDRIAGRTSLAKNKSIR